jgi:hypothetical protein
MTCPATWAGLRRSAGRYQRAIDVRALFSRFAMTARSMSDRTSPSLIPCWRSCSVAWFTWRAQDWRAAFVSSRRTRLAWPYASGRDTLVVRKRASMVAIRSRGTGVSAGVPGWSPPPPALYALL